MLSNRVSVRKNFSMGCINNSLSLARKYRDQIFVHAFVPTSGHISRGRLEVNYELRRTGNAQEQISQLIFAPNAGYCVFYISSFNISRNTCSFQYWGISQYMFSRLSLEPRTEVYCFRLNFNTSQVVYCTRVTMSNGI